MIRWRRLKCINCGKTLTPLRQFLGLERYQSKTSELEKFVAIELNWPLLLVAFEQDRTLLERLAEYAEGPERDISSLPNNVAHWAKYSKLVGLIRFGCVDDEGRQDLFEWSKYTLRSVNLEKLLQVSPKVRDIEVGITETERSKPESDSSIEISEGTSPVKKVAKRKVAKKKAKKKVKKKAKKKVRKKAKKKKR